ncbi:MAG: LytTR family transcriptional regulator, partial [Pseudomonadota bacterium]
MAELGTASATFEAGASEAEVELALPPELRNRVQRFEIAGERSAGAVALADDSLARREVALLTQAEDEAQDLLSPLYYLRNALQPTADLIEGDLETILPANPDVLVFADVAQLSPTETAEILEWVENGGLLLRFAGPSLAASDVSRSEEDALMPVRLRSGGRTVGGALSWGEPKALRPFDEASPFFGLDLSDEVTVSSQIVAQPDPTLADRTIAALADGTPLVTRKPVGEGQVVLFHVTANAEWSTLPISGLFVQMLERLAVSTRPAALDPEALEGTTWVPRVVLDGFGTGRDAGDLAGVPGEDLVEPAPGPDLPPGLYEGPGQSLALNVLGAEATLESAIWPTGTVIEGLTRAAETNLMPYLLAAALILLTVDAIASLWLGGRLRRLGGSAALLAVFLLGAPQAEAQDFVPTEVALAHILTGDPRADDVAQAGLLGLSSVLTQRTSVEPAAPIGVDLEVKSAGICSTPGSTCATCTASTRANKGPWW